MTTRWHCHLAGLLLGVLGLTGITASGRASGEVDVWGTMPVPGGFEALQQGVRLVSPPDHWRTIPLVIEMSHAGVDGLRIIRLVERHAESLRASEGAGRPPAAVAPLPLGMSWWSPRFEREPQPQDLLWAILASREMSSLYYGLLALDDETLQAVAGDDELARVLVRHALIVPTVSVGLRMETGQVRPAGGARTAPLWEELVGERLDAPARFIDKLLRVDEGRLAHFFATVAVLPGSTASFVLRDRDGLHDAYRAFASALEGWRADAMIPPPPDGPADVLFTLAARPDGSLVGPPWRDFWREAFDGDNPDRRAPSMDADSLVDAAGLIEAICPQRCDRDRLATLALLQRTAPQPAITDAPDLLQVARVRMRYPALAMEVERIGAGPAVWAGLGHVADALERLSEPVRTVSIVQFQSTVALLARLRTAGAPAALTEQYATELAALPVSERGFDGRLALWLGGWLVNGSEPADADAAGAIVHTLAGGPWFSEGPRVEWEGIEYRVDPPRTEAARLLDLLGRFTVNSLATAVDFAGLAADLPAAAAGGRGEAVMLEADAVFQRAREVAPVWWGGSAQTLWSPDKEQPRLASALRQIRPDARRRTELAARMLTRAADVVAADALAALVYALVLHDEQNAFALRSDLSRRHVLSPRGGDKRRAVWRPATEVTPQAGGRHIEGSLLALETGVPELCARRMHASRPEREPNISPQLATALRRTAAVASVTRRTDDEIEAVGAAHARGERVVRGWFSGEQRAALDAAGIVGARAGWLRWSIARGVAEQDVLRIEDVVRIGLWSAGGDPPQEPPASSGCRCLALPAVSWEARGQPQDPDVAIGLWPEPSLRVALELRRRGVPGAVAPGVLVLLTTDLVERSQIPHPTDVAALAESVRRVAAERFDDYVAAVAARGVLVRVEDDR